MLMIHLCSLFLLKWGSPLSQGGQGLESCMRSTHKYELIQPTQSIIISFTENSNGSGQEDFFQLPPLHHVQWLSKPCLWLPRVELLTVAGVTIMKQDTERQKLCPTDNSNPCCLQCFHPKSQDLSPSTVGQWGHLPWKRPTQNQSPALHMVPRPL